MQSMVLILAYLSDPGAATSPRLRLRLFGGNTKIAVAESACDRETNNNKVWELKTDKQNIHS